jgi:3-deoxy-D-manno-octulosonic-acid transferase
VHLALTILQKYATAANDLRKNRIFALNNSAVYLIYNLTVRLLSFFLELIAMFHQKIRLFVEGRKTVFPYLENKIAPGDAIIWVHCASLGEFEQGLPVVEKLKTAYPDYKVLITFFSPSGYEIKKNSTVAEFITYLPLDTRHNANRFLNLVQPKLAIFVKYEIWPNYLKTLQEKEVPILLISAIFKQKQVFFTWYGAFMRTALTAFTHIFVQNQTSKSLLQAISIDRVTVNGDTRFDRVAEILERDNSLAFMSQFKQNQMCLVAGSTWPEDETILVHFINTSSAPLKYVLAPHTVKPEKLKSLVKSITKRTVLFSELANKDISACDVLILDTIGILTKVYSYATLAYVGGGFATGLHNTLEPAVFGIPVIIGPHFTGFKEVEDLVTKEGIFPVKNNADFGKVLGHFLTQPGQIEATGRINTGYIVANQGATLSIMNYIQTLLPKIATSS